MTVALTLLGVFLIAHLPGLRRLALGARPADRAASALAAALAVDALLHFTRPERYLTMLPEGSPSALVTAGGVVELLLAAALLVPRARRVAGWGSLALLLLVLPFEWSALFAGRVGPARPAAGLLLVGVSVWVGLGHVPGLALRRRLFARLYDRTMRGYEEWAAPRRRALVEELRGRVVELGPGTGVNLPLYDPSVEWAGVEPNEHMRAALEARARELGREVRWHAGLEELPDASVDAVVSTLVLCSVPDPVRTLEEVRRVLRPGGRLAFLEHVAAPRGTGVRRAQRALRPCWRFFADGCNPDRELEPALEAAGFSVTDVERFVAPREAVPPIVGPHLQGAVSGDRMVTGAELPPLP